MYSLMSRFYSEIFPLTLDKISFAQKSTFIGKSYRILDVGCSTGDLCIALAKNGHHMTGIDLDDAMIETAVERLQNFPKLTIDYQKLDMLHIKDFFQEQQFHQVLCFGNTIVHLTQLNEIYSFFSQAADVLKSTGVFKGQILNYDHILNMKIKELPVIETETLRFERSYQFEGSILHFQTILKNKIDNSRQKSSIPLLPLRYDLLNELLHNAGFREIKYYGNFKLDPYTEDSFYLVFEAFK